MISDPLEKAVEVVSCDLWPLWLSDVDNNGFISKDELHNLFKAANLSLPGYKIREMVQELMKTSDKLTFEEFTEVSSVRVIWLTPSEAQPNMLVMFPPADSPRAEELWSGQNLPESYQQEGGNL